MGALVLADNFADAHSPSVTHLNDVVEGVVRGLGGRASTARDRCPVSVHTSWEDPPTGCGSVDPPADAKGVILRWVQRLIEWVGKAESGGGKVARVVWVTCGELLPPRGGEHSTAGAPLYGFLRDLCCEGGASLAILELGGRGSSCAHAWSRALACPVDTEPMPPPLCVDGRASEGGASSSGVRDGDASRPAWRGHLSFRLHAINPYVSFHLRSTSLGDGDRHDALSVPGFLLRAVGDFEWAVEPPPPQSPVEVLYLAPGRSMPMHYLLRVGWPVLLLPDPESGCTATAADFLADWPAEVALACRATRKGGGHLYIFLHGIDSCGLRGVVVDVETRPPPLGPISRQALPQEEGDPGAVLSADLLRAMDALRQGGASAHPSPRDTNGSTVSAWNAAPETRFLCKVVPEESTRSQRRASLRWRKRARGEVRRRAGRKAANGEDFKPSRGPQTAAAPSENWESMLDSIVRERLLILLGSQGKVHPHHDFLLERALSACRSALGMDDGRGIPGVEGTRSLSAIMLKVADAQCALLVGLVCPPENPLGH